MSFWEYTFGERFQLAKPCYVHLSIIRASTHAHRVSKRSLCVFHSHHLLCVQLRTRYVIDLLNWPAKNSAFYRKRNNCNWNGEREQWHFSRKLVVSKIVFSKFLSENEIFFFTYNENCRLCRSNYNGKSRELSRNRFSTTIA